jgi:pyocin large subunit-like protein
MDQRRLIRLALALVVAAGAWLTQQYRVRSAAPVPASPQASSQPAAPAPTAPVARQGHPEIGFRDPGHLHEHYQKHGAEFGQISETEYLRRAQALRDRPAGGDILEAVRADGVVTRFDRASGAFLAFDRDLTIRTFFQPNDGERYFTRQLARGRSDS